MPGISGLGHVGLYCNDLEKMRDFYARVLGLTISDEDLERGICFLSAAPDAEHHELALVRAREPGQKTHNVQQVSFKVRSLDDVRAYHRRLRDAGLNLRAVHAFPSGALAQIDLVPEDSSAFEEAARQAKLELSEKKTAFLVEGDDRPGAVAATLEKLGNAGINVTALSAVRSGGGRYGALFWVAPAEIEKAAQTLGAR